MKAEHESTLLAELRELHRSERAPAELERSVLARLLPARGTASLGARLRAWCSQALGAEQPLGWAVLGATLGTAAVVALYLGVRAPSVSTRVPEPESQVDVAGEEGRAQRCPLDELSPGFNYEPTRVDAEVALAGLQLDTFAMPIPGCPDLVRRALRYVPPGLVRGPVLIVLHDKGDTAEAVRARQAYRGFERLAEGVGFIVVYAGAAPAAGHSPSSGVWQTDPGANRAIDDVAYLARIVERLGERGLLLDETAGSGSDVFLVGFGSGAQLALEAAAQHPKRYLGVAAILPDRVNRTRPPPRAADSRFARLLFVTLKDERPGAYWAGAPLDATVLDEWNIAVGNPHITTERSTRPELPVVIQAPGPPNAVDEASLIARGVVPAGTRVFDNPSPDKGGPIVRTVVVPSKAVLQPGPGGSPPPLDAPALVWEFFQRGALGYHPPPGTTVP